MRRIGFLLLLFPCFVFSQLQSSGPISIGDIRSEAGETGAYSLFDAATDFSLPTIGIAMSDFYGESIGGGGGSCNTTFIVEQFNLRYHATDSNCANHTTILTSTYGSSTALNNTTGLYTDNNGNCTPRPTGWYSNGTSRLYWDAGTETISNKDLCPF
jgi:hypothetical protein